MMYNENVLPKWIQNGKGWYVSLRVLYNTRCYFLREITVHAARSFVGCEVEKAHGWN